MRIRGNQPLSPSSLGNGQEQYQTFRSRGSSRKWFIQFDYRALMAGLPQVEKRKIGQPHLCLKCLAKCLAE
jgi:hypothetical protein